MARKTYKNIITSSELYEKINKDNIKLMEKFLKEKNTRSSDLTIEGYRSDLIIFFTWNLQNNDNIHFTNIRKIQFSEFFAFAVEEMRWGSARFARAKSCLSSFANYIEKFYDDQWPMFRNLVLKAVESLPKNAVREKIILSDDQIDDLIKKLENIEEFQIACWVSLGIASGSRFSEILRFTTDLIDENCTAFDGLFLETTKVIKTKGRGKGGKLLKKYILKDLFLDKYNTWISIRNKIMKENNKEHDFIFIKENGDPANDGTARSWISKIENVVEQPFYAHLMRHQYTTRLSRIGIPPELIKELVGWSNLNMIEVYNDLGVKDRSWSELSKLKEHLESKNKQ